MMDLEQFGQRLDEPQTCGEWPMFSAMPLFFLSNRTVDLASQRTRSGLCVLGRVSANGSGGSSFFGVAS